VTALTPDERIALAMRYVADYKIYPAIGELENVVREHPHYVKAYVHLGLLHFKLVAIAKGREYLQKALACNPTPEERQLINSALSEQNKLDQNRYYRPDFEALRKRKTED
jgi:Tfp pilus assembly protein PilF